MKNNANANFNNDWLQRYMCSAFASACAEASTFPIDTLKVHQQLTKGVDRSGNSRLGRLFEYRTLKLLYSGVNVAVTRSIIYGGFTVSMYNPIRNFICGIKLENSGIVWPNISSDSVNVSNDGLFVQKLIAGCMCGGMSQYITQPIDLCKALLQAQTKRTISESLLAITNERTATILPTTQTYSLFQVLRAVYMTDGIRGLWRGSSISVQRAAVINGSWIAVYDHCKVLTNNIIAKLFTVHTRNEPYINVFNYVLSSQLSGFISCVCTAPFDVAKTRLLCQQPLPNIEFLNVSRSSYPTSVSSTSSHSMNADISHSISCTAAPVNKTEIAKSVGSTHLYTGTIDVFSRTIREEGVRALYKGFVPSLVRVGPWSLVFFLVYEGITAVVFGQSQI